MSETDPKVLIVFIILLLFIFVCLFVVNDWRMRVLFH